MYRDVTTNKVLSSEAGRGDVRPVVARPPLQMDKLDPALGCSGLMSIFSYDSHPVSRRRNCDELPRRNNARAGNRSVSPTPSQHKHKTVERQKDNKYHRNYPPTPQLEIVDWS